MKIIQARNINTAYPKALRLLTEEGVRRESRNGPVLVMNEPVTICYENPLERVLFDVERDCNPFFHLYESLWMLEGRNDVKSLSRYVKQIEQYSDDGITLHGSYGFRWRNHFGIDQLEIIAERLQKDPNDRRCVLSMWDTKEDLGKEGKDFPCNLICTLSRDKDGALDLTVFQRSGDLVWGIMGANVVQFSTLQEYMANWIGCSVGKYHQITSNFHAYLSTFPTQIHPPRDLYSTLSIARNIFMSGPIRIVDDNISSLLNDSDQGFPRLQTSSDSWVEMVYNVLHSHYLFKKFGKYEALENLWKHNQGSDWELAAAEWLGRRADKKQN